MKITLNLDKEEAGHLMGLLLAKRDEEVDRLRHAKINTLEEVETREHCSACKQFYYESQGIAFRAFERITVAKIRAFNKVISKLAGYGNWIERRRPLNEP